MPKELPPELIQDVWERASVIPGQDPAMYRRDTCGAVIRRDMFNSNQHPRSQGWEIDHIRPLTKGGSNSAGNLQALQWENNRHKDTNELAWVCRVTGGGEGNRYT